MCVCVLNIFTKRIIFLPHFHSLSKGVLSLAEMQVNLLTTVIGMVTNTVDSYIQLDFAFFT